MTSGLEPGSVTRTRSVIRFLRRSARRSRALPRRFSLAMATALRPIVTLREPRGEPAPSAAGAHPAAARPGGAAANADAALEDAADAVGRAQLDAGRRARRGARRGPATPSGGKPSTARRAFTIPAPYWESGPAGPASRAVASRRFTTSWPRSPFATSSAATPATCGAAWEVPEMRV